MTVGLEEFVRQLADSGVISPGTLENFIPPKAHPKDVHELARQLVRQKHLTRFQAQQIYQGHVRSLILGNYTILDKIGAGGMGQVFKAQHRRMERLVAIKTLPTATTKDPIALARFEREVKAAARLSHPNVVAAYDADEAGGVSFLVMEYVDGWDLSALVKKNGPFAVGRAVDYVLQAARGLEYAHGEGIVHRDIKPANLLLDRKGTIKILDMGLARIAGGAASGQAELTGTGAVMGTVDFMAPEQALSTKHVDARADIYSLGCTLYYLLSARALYDGDTLMARLLAHREAPIATLRDVQPDAPELLQAVFAKMVAKRAEDRYQTMTEAIADLARCATGETAGGGLTSFSPTAASDAVSFLAEAPQATPKRPSKAKPAAKAGGGRVGAWPSRRVMAAIGAGAVLAVVLTAWSVLHSAGRSLKQRPSAMAAAGPDQVEAPAAREGYQGLPRPAATADGSQTAAMFEPGPDFGVLPGLVPRPARLPGVRRWQIETLAPQTLKEGMAVSPDDRLLALGDWQGHIRIYELATWRPVAFMAPGGEIEDLSWSADGKLLASANNLKRASNPSEPGVRVWKADGTAVRGWMPGIGACRVAWSPDGQTLLASCGSGFALWKSDGTRVAENQTLGARIAGIAWSPDSKQFATAGPKAVRIWNRDGTPHSVLDETESAPGCVAWSRQGTLASFDQKSLYIWKAGGQPRKIAAMNAGRSLTWSPDGHQLAIAPQGGDVSVFGEDGAPISKLPKTAATFHWALWLSDGKRIAHVNRDGDVEVIPIVSGQRSILAATCSGPSLLAATHEGNRLATVCRIEGSRSVIATWQRDGKPLLGIDPHWSSGATIGCLAFSRDGRLACDAPENTMQIWEPDGGPGPRLRARTPGGASIAWSPDGKRLAAAIIQTDKLMKLLLWNVDGSSAGELPGFRPSAWPRLAWGPDGRIACSFDKGIQTWQADGKPGPTIVLPAANRTPSSIAISPDGKQLAASWNSSNDSIGVWGMDGKPGPVFPNPGPGERVAWCRDNRRVLAVGANRLRLLSVDGNIPGQIIPLPQEAASAVTLAGNRVAVLESFGNTLLALDIETHAPLWRGVMLPDGSYFSIAAGGAIFRQSPSQPVENSIFCVIEQADGRLQIETPAEFAKRIGGHGFDSNAGG